MTCLPPEEGLEGWYVRSAEKHDVGLHRESVVAVDATAHTVLLAYDLVRD